MSDNYESMIGIKRLSLIATAFFHALNLRLQNSREFFHARFDFLFGERSVTENQTVRRIYTETISRIEKTIIKWHKTKGSCNRKDV